MKKIILALLTLTSNILVAGIHGDEFYTQGQADAGYAPVQSNVCSAGLNAYYPQGNNCYVQQGCNCNATCGCGCVRNGDSDFGVYFNSTVGVSLLNYNGQAGFVGTIAGGYKFFNDIHLQGELGYRYHRIYGVNLNTYSFMANGIYDFQKIWNITPYAGFGLGYATTHANAHSDYYSISVRVNDFVMQGIFGLTYKVLENRYLGLEYRIFGNGKDVYDHSLVISARRFI